MIYLLTSFLNFGEEGENFVFLVDCDVMCFPPGAKFGTEIGFFLILVILVCWN